MGFTPLDERIRIYWGVEGVVEHCSTDGVDGCFRTSRPRGIFASDWDVIRHELVHALGARSGIANPFIEEGIAVSLTAVASLEADFSRSLGDTIELGYDVYLADTDSVDVLTAAHFFTFMVRKYGVPKVMEIKGLVPDGSSIGDVNHAFESALGKTLDEAENEWRTEAPLTYTPLREGCEKLPVPWREQTLGIGADLDCGAPETMVHW